MPTILPRVRPEARSVLERDGSSPGAARPGSPRCAWPGAGASSLTAAVSCTTSGFKPALCALFPLSKDLRGRSYVRQKGYQREQWNLPCLDPAPGTPPAAESLRAEIALAESYENAPAAEEGQA